MNFKVGDKIVLKAFPQSKTRRMIVGENERYYYICFNNETEPSQCEKSYINRKFRKITKLEEALK